MGNPGVASSSRSCLSPYAVFFGGRGAAWCVTGEGRKQAEQSRPHSHAAIHKVGRERERDEEEEAEEEEGRWG